jgi:ABC-type oligopeptide transport system substrate-binding subunit
MKRASMRISSVFLAMAALIACGGSDSTSPSGTVAGSYTATQFTTTGSSGQTNQLLAGSTLVINLAASGTTTGHLHLAPQGGSPAFDADMAGTWAQTGSTVTFSQTADTFVRDIPFTAVANGSKWALEGSGSFSGTAVQITLSQ